MKSIKVLLISFIITFVTLISISPANATPTVKVQHLNVGNTLTSTFNSYDVINLTGELPSHFLTNNRNSLSTGLFLANQTIFSEKNAQITIEIVKKSNDFFTSVMVFNDKLHQLISYFNSPANKDISESVVPSSESDVIKKKCDSTLNFS
jgi:hypothetical protein